MVSCSEEAIGSNSDPNSNLFPVEYITEERDRGEEELVNFVSA